MSSMLKNKVFISTRPKGQNGELAMLINQHGGELLEMPTIEIKPAKLTYEQEDLLDHISQFSWIVFTSPNSIRFFFEKLYEVTASYDLPSSIKTAVVGRKTGQLLLDFGHETTLENPGNTAEDLAEELAKAVNNEDLLLFPEGDLARSVISQRISSVAECVHLTVYQNVLPDNINSEYLTRITKNQYDGIILTSPSSFNNLKSALKNKVDAKKLKLICIGSTTASELEVNGIKPIAVASMASTQGIVEAIIDSYN